MTVGELLVRIGVDGSGVATGLTKVESQLERLGTRMYFMGSRITVGFSAPIGALLGAVSKIGIDFDRAMTESLAIMDNVGEEMRRSMERTAIDVSRSTKFAAKEAAEGYYHLASAGLDAQQSMEALPIVAQFAQAGVMDLAKSAEFLAGATAAMGMRTGDATQDMQNMARVADVLTMANNKALGTIQDFASALTNKAANQLHYFNKSVEEGTAILMAYASQNIKGRLAGQQLAMFLRDVSRYSLKNADDWKRMGVAVFDTTGKMLPAADILKQMEDRLRNMSDAQRGYFFQQLGMSERSTAATKALIGYSEAIRRWEEELKHASGTTAAVAAKQMQAIGNQLLQMWHRLQNIGIKLFQEWEPIITKEILPAMDKFINKLDELADRMAEMPNWAKKWLLIGAAFAAVLGPIVMVMGAMTLAIRALASIPVWMISLLTGGGRAAAMGAAAGAGAGASAASVKGAKGLLYALQGPANPGLKAALGAGGAASVIKSLQGAAGISPEARGIWLAMQNPAAMRALTGTAGAAKAAEIMKELAVAAGLAAPKVGLFSRALGALSGPVGWVITGIAQLALTFRDWAGSWTRVLDALRILNPPLAFTIDSLRLLIKYLPSVTSVVKPLVKQLGDLYEVMSTIASAGYWSLGWIFNRFADIGAYLKPEEIYGWIDAVITRATEKGGWSDTLGDWFKTGASSLKTIVTGSVEGIVSWITTELKAAWWNVSIDADNAWHGIGATVQDVWTQIKDTVSSVSNTIASTVTDKLGAAWDWLRADVSGSWGVIKDTVSKAWDWIVTDIQATPLFQWIGEQSASAWNTVTTGAAKAIDWIRNYFSGVRLFGDDNLSQMLLGMWDGLRNAAETTWDWISNKASDTANTISGFFSGVRFFGEDPLSQSAKSMWDTFIQGAQSAMSFVRDWLSDGLWGDQDMSISGLWEDFKKIGQNAIDWVTSYFKDVRWIGTEDKQIQEYWDSFKSTAQGTFDWLSGAWADVTNEMKPVWQQFIDWARDKLKSLFPSAPGAPQTPAKPKGAIGQAMDDLWERFSPFSDTNLILGANLLEMGSYSPTAPGGISKLAGLAPALGGYTETVLKKDQWNQMIKDLWGGVKTPSLFAPAAPPPPGDYPTPFTSLYGGAPKPFFSDKDISEIAAGRTPAQFDPFAAWKWQDVQNIIDGDWPTAEGQKKTPTRFERMVDDMVSQLSGEGGEKLKVLETAFNRITSGKEAANFAKYMELAGKQQWAVIAQTPALAKYNDILKQTWDRYSEMRPNLSPLELATNKFEGLFKTEIKFGEEQQRINSIIEQGAKFSQLFGYKLDGLGSGARKLVDEFSAIEAFGSQNKMNPMAMIDWAAIPTSFFEKNAEALDELYETKRVAEMRGETVSYGEVLDTIIAKYVWLGTTGQLNIADQGKAWDAVSKKATESFENISAKYADARSTLELYTMSFGSRDIMGVKKTAATNYESRQDEINKMVQAANFALAQSIATQDEYVKKSKELEYKGWMEKIRIAQMMSVQMLEIDKYTGWMRLAEAAGIGEAILKKYRNTGIQIIENQKTVMQAVAMTMGLPMHTFDAYFDEMITKMLGKTNKELEALIKLKMQLKAVRDETQKYINIVSGLGTLLTSLGFEKVGAWLGDVASAMTAGADAASSFRFSIASGDWAQAAADIMNMVGAMAKATDAFHKWQRVAGGAATGAAIGNQILPGLGALIGAGVGALIGAFRKNAGEETKKLIDRYIPTTFFGGASQGLASSGVSEELATKIGETSKSLFSGNYYAGMIYSLKDLLDEMGGLTSENFQMMTFRLRDVFSLIKSGAFTSAQGVKVLDENFQTFADFLDKNNLVSSPMFRDLIRLNAELAEGSQAIKDYVKALTQKFNTGIEKLVAFVGGKYNLNDLGEQAYDAALKVATLKSQLANLRAIPGHNEDEETRLVDELEKAQKELDDIRSKASGTAAAAADDFERIGVLMLAMFNGALKAGESLLDVLEDLGPSMKKWIGQMEAAGYNIKNPAVQTLVDLSNRASANPEIVQGFQGLNEAALALANSGSMTPEAWQAVQDMAKDLVARAEKAGFTQGQIIAMLAPFLNVALQIPGQLGLTLDPVIANLIVEGKKLDLIKDAIIDQQGILIQGFAAMISAMNGTLPAAFVEWLKKHGLMPGENGPEPLPGPRPPGPGPGGPGGGGKEGDPSDPRDPGDGRERRPRFDSGGIVWGPTVAELAWNGKPEAIIPLDDLRSNTPNPVVMENHFTIQCLDPRTAVQVVKDEIKPILDDLWKQGGREQTKTRDSLRIP